MALNDYKIIKELGSGGFGKTYLVQARNLPGKPKRVLKHFSPSQKPTPEGLQILQRLFEKEATMLGKLGHHPQIPSLYEFFEEGGEFFFVQEYVQGKDLRSEEIKDGIKLSEQKVLALLEEILEVLQFIHERDAIHLDLKPENIMRRKLDGKIVLIDFGGAKQTSALEVRPGGNTVMTVTVGTSGYMPSEQSQQKPRPASDVYAVGKIAIQALTGRHPYHIPEDAHTDEVLWRGLASGVNPDFAKVLDKMISYQFKDRYKNAEEALKAVRELKAKNQPILLTPNFNFDPNIAFSPRPNFSPPIFGKPNLPFPPAPNNPIAQTPKKNVGKLQKKSASEVILTSSYSFWFIALMYAFGAFSQMRMGIPVWFLVTWFLSGTLAMSLFLKTATNKEGFLNFGYFIVIISHLVVVFLTSNLMIPPYNPLMLLPGTPMTMLNFIFINGFLVMLHKKLSDISAEEDDIAGLVIVIGLLIVVGCVFGIVFRK
jgi:serine/threonine protein kinase